MSSKELTCPSCLSPLISEAVKTGKCQCCGHTFNPDELRQEREKEESAAEATG